MTRGYPAVWSSLFGAPFVACGAYVYALQSRYPLVTDQPTVPSMAGVPLVLFGLFVVGLGVYVQFASAPDRPRMREGERIVDERDPAQRSALLKAFSSVPFLAAGLDLLYLTTYPLVYPTAVLAVGLYLFSTGIHEYWRNTLTSYVLTDRRMLEEYRFVSLSRNEVPLEKVRAVRERRSFLDTLFGLGDVYVRAGATGDLSVTVRSVYDSTEFADAIRREMDGASGAGGTESPAVETAGVLAWDDVEASEPGGDVESPPGAFGDGDDPVGEPSPDGSGATSAGAGRESLSDGGTTESVPTSDGRS